MKASLLVAAVVTLAVTANATSALAEGPRASSSNAIVQTAKAQSGADRPTTGHWEWQYHYVGHQPRLEGHWVFVR